MSLSRGASSCRQSSSPKRANMKEEGAVTQLLEGRNTHTGDCPYTTAGHNWELLVGYLWCRETGKLRQPGRPQFQGPHKATASQDKPAGPPEPPPPPCLSHPALPPALTFTIAGAATTPTGVAFHPRHSIQSPGNEREPELCSRPLSVHAQAYSTLVSPKQFSCCRFRLSRPTRRRLSQGMAAIFLARRKSSPAEPGGYLRFERSGRRPHLQLLKISPGKRANKYPLSTA
ncbi:hypothetical protein XELAEV_18015831mg [Xenopus laevis]|uniref:Uncharacterized protein n=1 Tax=Xenopus laevis TaxID=8355 RepID=A0A974DJF0_XENLA|nr:hypothetical protein XELAEV_18015831mg [Xenopus laevis]